MPISPICSLPLIDLSETRTISGDEISILSVGEKAYGLACLPRSWTLPFVVVSSRCISAYRSAATSREQQTLVQDLARSVQEAFSIIDENLTGNIYVRSSAVSESLQERGRYHSVQGSSDSLEIPLAQCLEKLTNDQDIRSEQVHLIVQIAVTPVSAKGHLSNERRCYKEDRDWLGEFEAASPIETSTFTVNLRNWRRIVSGDSTHLPLLCNLKPSISAVLATPASWAKHHNVRMHYEWVWNGKRLFIVQADEAKPQPGINPTKIHRFSEINTATYIPKCLKQITEDHAALYNKVRNVKTYLSLNLPTTNLYVLDDPAILDRLRLRDCPPDLIEDLEALVPNSLVIRTDLATDDQNLRQLLPRTNEVRCLNAALSFLQQTLNDLDNKGVTIPVAFIFHNYIPAVSSAFAYAAPGKRKVLIEALWGLPEGLYYNSHDKIEVDLGVSSISGEQESVKERFKIQCRPRFKMNFVAPDESGNWVPQRVSEPWDWKLSIKKDEWIRQIAYASKLIAEREGRALSVMWFVEVPSWASAVPVFPWYHEPFDFSLSNRSAQTRKKTPYDRSFTIHTKSDIDVLEREAAADHSSIRQVRIQPTETDLVRDKELLKKVGVLTKQIGAVIVLEGGMLSHAYYQLLQTNAPVEVVNPFEVSEDKREFNKLVRDKIPHRIHQGGESVRFARLAGDELLQVLRVKLVEEAYEALDASDQSAIVDELADVEEVINGILKQLKVSRRELTDRQRSKSSKAGRFDDGIVLLDTQSQKLGDADQVGSTLPLAFDDELRGSFEGTENEYWPPSPILNRWSDLREHQSANERLVSLVVSLVGDQWSAESPDIRLADGTKGVVRAKIHGQRQGGALRLEISIYSPSTQLSLFDD